MTLTTPGCPMADSLSKGVECRVRQIKDVSKIAADLVFP
ncbi:hypothetical protein [Pseudogracilibacillus sp. SO30301A]